MRRAVNPSATAFSTASLHALLVDLVGARIRQRNRDQRQPCGRRLGVQDFLAHAVHRHAPRVGVDRGQQAADFADAARDGARAASRRCPCRCSTRPESSLERVRMKRPRERPRAFDDPRPRDDDAIVGDELDAIVSDGRDRRQRAPDGDFGGERGRRHRVVAASGSRESRPGAAPGSARCWPRRPRCFTSAKTLSPPATRSMSSRKPMPPLA